VTIRFLLDTSIVSAPAAKVPNDRVVRRIERHMHEAAIASPVWHELLYGVQRLPRGRRRDALAAYVEDVVGASFPVLPYDESAAAWHARERARLEAMGKTHPYVDAQIAAIAKTNDLVLVTAHPRDFASFTDLAVEDWTRPRAR
jgi:tRNA(fMet)-specific endonuclease VapC